jgi:hypothetical protein
MVALVIDPTAAQNPDERPWPTTKIAIEIETNRLDDSRA